MVGPVDDGMYYCLGKEHGYCDRRSGTCFCNVGYQGISCQDCSSTHYEQGGLCYPKLVWPRLSLLPLSPMLLKTILDPVKTTVPRWLKRISNSAIRPRNFGGQTINKISLVPTFRTSQPSLGTTPPLPSARSYARVIAAEPGRATTPTVPARACRIGWETTALSPTVPRCSALGARSVPSKGARRVRAAITWIMRVAGLSAYRVIGTTRAARGERRPLFLSGTVERHSRYTKRSTAARASLIRYA